MKLPKPIKHDVILMPERAGISRGGIILVGDTPKQPRKGTVMDVGPYVEEVDIGDLVLYNHHAAKAIEHEGVEYLVVNANELFAIIQKNDSTGDSGN